MSLPTRGNGGKIIRHLHLYCPLSLPCSSWPRQFYSCTCETIESIRIPPPTTLATPDSTNYTSICLAPALSTRPSQSAFSPMAKRTTTPLPCSASVIRFAVRSFLVQDNKKGKKSRRSKSGKNSRTPGDAAEALEILRRFVVRARRVEAHSMVRDRSVDRYAKPAMRIEFRNESPG